MPSTTTSIAPTGRLGWNRQTHPPGWTILGADDRGTVQHRDLLGGLLHEYRQAA
jgi:hypothetical protein